METCLFISNKDGWLFKVYVPALIWSFKPRFLEQLYRNYYYHLSYCEYYYLRWSVRFDNHPETKKTTYWKRSKKRQTLCGFASPITCHKFTLRSHSLTLLTTRADFISYQNFTRQIKIMELPQKPLSSHSLIT